MCAKFICTWLSKDWYELRVVFILTFYMINTRVYSFKWQLAVRSYLKLIFFVSLSNNRFTCFARRQIIAFVNMLHIHVIPRELHREKSCYLTRASGIGSDKPNWCKHLSHEPFIGRLGQMTFAYAICTSRSTQLLFQQQRKKSRYVWFL